MPRHSGQKHQPVPPRATPPSHVCEHHILQLVSYSCGGLCFLTSPASRPGDVVCA